MNSWGAIYNRHLKRGEDHGSAAYAADQWEKRKHLVRWRYCSSTHCERSNECRSPHDCTASVSAMRLEGKP